MPIKIVIYFAVYKRLEILKICLKGIERLQSDKRYDIDTFAVCSSKEESKVLSQFGVKHIIYPNDPLGAKKNAGLRACLTQQWDYLMELGSDDLLHSDILDLYYPYFKEGRKAFGINHCWFYDTVTGKSAKFYCDYAIGAGRVFHRSVFEKLADNYTVKYKASFVTPNGVCKRNHVAIMPKFFATMLVKGGLADLISDKARPLEFWTPSRQRALDGDSMMRCAVYGIKIDVIDTPPEKHLCLDIKSGQNINSFDRFEATDYNILQHFPEAEDIKRLCQ